MKLRVAFLDLANKPKGNGGYIILVQEPIKERSFGILKRITDECGVTSMQTAHAHLRIRMVVLHLEIKLATSSFPSILQCFKALFLLFQTDAHNYKIIGILKQLKFRLSLRHVSVHAGTIIRELFRA